MKHILKNISFGLSQIRDLFSPGTKIIASMNDAPGKLKIDSRLRNSSGSRTNKAVAGAILVWTIFLSTGCQKDNEHVADPGKLIVLDAIHANGKLQTQFHYGPNKKVSKMEIFANGWAAQPYQMNTFEYDANNVLKQIDQFYEGVNKYRTVYSSNQAGKAASAILAYLPDAGKIQAIFSYKHDGNGQLLSIDVENPEDLSKGGTSLFTYDEAGKLASITEISKSGNTQMKINCKSGIQLPASIAAALNSDYQPEFLLYLNKLSTTEMIQTFYKPESATIQGQYRMEYLQRKFDEQGNLVSQVEKIRQLKPVSTTGTDSETMLAYSYKEL